MPDENKKIKNSGGLLEKFAPVLLVLIVGLAFTVGALWQKVALLESGKFTKNVGNPTDSGKSGTLNGKLSADQAKKIPAVTDADHIRGSKDAQIYLIEYSDLECPFCKAFHPTAQKAVEQYKGQVVWIYRHFPLDTLHTKARDEAAASECAFNLGGEDAFWKFIDKVFSVTPSNNGLDAKELPKIATQIGLNQAAFNSCLSGGKTKDKIEKQYQGGVDAGVTGTPGNFIVNKKGEAWIIPGAVPFETLKLTIDEALKN